MKVIIPVKRLAPQLNVYSLYFTVCALRGTIVSQNGVCKCGDKAEVAYDDEKVPRNILMVFGKDS